MDPQLRVTKTEVTILDPNRPAIPLQAAGCGCGCGCYCGSGNTSTTAHQERDEQTLAIALFNAMLGGCS